MRTAFIDQLIKEAQRNPRIFLVVGDLGFSVVEPFVKQFPDRYLNVGVAEQNMTGVAAGLAMEGYNVFTYSIGNFPTLRCLEQIRYDVCYHNANVKIVAVGGGYAYGPLGASHHATEDLGILRTLPGMVVTAPGDPHEARVLTTLMSEYEGPGYLRLGKAGEPEVHTSSPVLAWGKLVPALAGQGTVVLATGAVLKTAVDFVTSRGLGWGVCSVPFVKPLDLDGLLELARQYPSWITLEEHQRSCGLGSAILEGINDLQEQGALAKPPSVRRIAIPDRFQSQAGSQEYLRSLSGLDLGKLV